MARLRTALLAALIAPLAAQAPAEAPAPDKKAQGLQAQEEAIIRLYRKGARSRLPAPKGRPLPEEQNNIRRFKEAKGSVVYISTLADEINRYTGDVMRVPAGTGTGWVWDDKGHIVTNLHVVTVESGQISMESDDVRVTLADGKTYQARIIGRSLAYDTAVLQVFAPLEDLKPLPIGTSKDLEVGQSVIAIGNPWGLDHTLSTGVVSALNRVLPTDFHTEMTGVIQTDAAINPGNSGGPLLDSAGRVIGMNAYIPAATGASVGIGFSIPIDTLNRVIPLLIARGQVFRPLMGFEAFTEPEAFNLGITRGAAVKAVERGGAADRAGLKGATFDAQGKMTAIGDVIIAIDGHRVGAMTDLAAYLEQAEPKDKITFDVVRGDQIVKVTLDLREGGGKI